MKNKKTASNSFSALFWNSCKRTCFIPILSFAYLFFLTIENYILFRNKEIYYNPKEYFGFFWNSMCYTGFSLVEAFLLIGGVLSGIILFRFAQSKKQCNVIFSLGISRRKIFLAKYLGGLLPLLAALIIAAFFELVSVFCCGYALSVPLIKIMVYFIVSMMGYYTFAFTISSAVNAYSGNIVESLIFIGIIAFLPPVAGLFFGTMRGFYTLGGISVYEGLWNFFNPYMIMGEFLRAFQTTNDYYFDNPNIADYFSVHRAHISITVYEFSGAIMSFVYAAIVFAIAFLFFPKRRNEISGTFGRAKGLNEICAVLTGFYSMTLLTHIVFGDFVTRDERFLAFLMSIGFFIVPYFVFKMVFANKRKLVLKTMPKRLSACIAAIAVVTVIFSTGLFGYASRIPDAEDIYKITYSPVLCNPYNTVNDTDALHRDTVYGYVPMEKYKGYHQTAGMTSLLNGNGSQNSYYTTYTVSDSENIRKIIDIHKSFVQKGHIKSTASDSCGINFEITYVLNNGKTIKRYYTATTVENAKRIVGLSDTDAEKALISEFFEPYADESYGRYGEEFNTIPAEENPNNYFYLYSKYLKENTRCGMITDELKKAVIQDLKNQTSEDIFFHKPEDELGVISFGIGLPYTVYIPDGCYEDENGDFVNEKTGEVTKRDDILRQVARERMNETDREISAMGYSPKSFVVTKSMTNTVKYLTENGYIKYFDTKITASDVKSMKLATKAETIKVKNTDMLPLFSAGYSNVKSVKESDLTVYESEALCNHYFSNNVNNEITSKTTIQKVLDNCYLFGFSGSNDRVVEVTFNDGSIATYCISAEVYDKLMK